MKSVRIPKKIEKVSLKWVQEAPFFSEFTLRFYYIECEESEMEIPTMGVGVNRGRLYLYYHKDFLEKISMPLLEFVMIHEVMHIISLHQDRKLPEQMVWNVATDMIINDNITTLRIAGKQIECWNQATYLSHAVKEGYQGSKISEELYEWLYKKYQQYKKQYGMQLQQCKLPGKGKGGKSKDGDGQGNKNSSGGGGDKDNSLKKMFRQMDAHDWIKKKLSDLDKKVVNEVIKSARMRSWGTMSGKMVEYLDALTKDRPLNWRQLLRKYTNIWTHGKGPIRIRSWSKHNRRQLPLPGYKRPHNDLVVAVDTSGSIDQEYFQMFFNEIETIVRDKDKLTILECDTQVNKVYNNYRRGDYKRISLHGRGGTNFGPVFDWMKEHKKAKSMLIYFTDLWAPWDFSTHGVKCIWCTPSQGEDAPADKGITIHIKKETKQA